MMTTISREPLMLSPNVKYFTHRFLSERGVWKHDQANK
jgi:hypothetical protein